ncbi:hypothetical protein ACIRQF_05590 [Streptomyces sp. NPDC101191]|uniref:hypothetical protein n=1 Tax=Streptomyces sp. NPDC101191 TaxID=3366126 RepID=UPI0037FD2487
MTTKHDEFLTQGVVGLLLSVAVASRNPGAAPLEDELQRLSRLLQDSSATVRVMPMSALASLLDQLADEAGTEVFGTRSAAYRDRLSRAAGAKRRPTSCAPWPSWSATASSSSAPTSRSCRCPTGKPARASR